MTFDKRQILKNVGSSWFALGVNVLVGIFLSPYILHHLGDDAFGLWVLIFSVTGYYGLFDLGIRSSIVRYIAKYSATAEEENLNAVFNTAILSYSVIGVVTLALTLIASNYVDVIFHIPGGFLPTAQHLLLIVGIAVSIGFPMGVFGGTLEGLQSFYVLNMTSLGATLLRAGLIVLALRHGHGLLSVALITVLLPLVSGIVNGVVVFRRLRLRLGLRFASWPCLRQIASYSGTTFVIILAGRLRFKTDALVIGTFLSAASITYFTIGSRLVDYASEVVSGLAQILLPMSSQAHATGDLENLRRIVVGGNRACALIVFPLTIVLTVYGKSIIELWVGSKYVSASYPILLVLMYPTTVMLAQSASGRTLWGMGKHGSWAWVVLAEGIANVVLSVLLVRPYGIMGDAVGTAIPLVCSMIFFLPYHICQLLQLKLYTYISRAFLWPFALCVPLSAALVVMQRWFQPHRWGVLLLQLTIGGAVYGAGVAWATLTHRVSDLRGLSPSIEVRSIFAGPHAYEDEA